MLGEKLGAKGLQTVLYARLNIEYERFAVKFVRFTAELHAIR